MPNRRVYRYTDPDRMLNIYQSGFVTDQRCPTKAEHPLKAIGFPASYLSYPSSKLRPCTAKNRKCDWLDSSALSRVEWSDCNESHWFCMQPEQIASLRTVVWTWKEIIFAIGEEILNSNSGRQLHESFPSQTFGINWKCNADNFTYYIIVRNKAPLTRIIGI